MNKVLAYAAVKAADVASTILGLKLGAAEANPLIQSVNLNPNLMWLGLVYTVGLMIIMAKVADWDQCPAYIVKIFKWLILVFIAATLIVVISNIIQIWRLL